MIFCKISMKEPSESSGQYYKAFYNMYSYVQLSNLAFHSLLGTVSDNDIKNFIDEYNGNITNDHERINVSLLGMGIDGRALYEKNSNCNIFTYYFDNLNKKGLNYKDILESFLNLQEFILIYALFEDNVKIIINNSRATQAGLMKELEVHLTNKNIIQNFQSEISKKTSGTIEQLEEIKSLWTYFTIIRNLYTHSAGVVTDRVLTDMEKIKDRIEDFCSKGNFLLLNVIADHDDEDVLNFLFEKEELYVMSDHQLNFFRSFVIYILETLDSINE